MDTDDNVLVGKAAISSGKRMPIHVELEPVAYIEADVSEEILKAATVLIELLLRSAARYHMVSGLHLESVRADYEKLQQQHQALMESERRYKNLAENLEQQVQKQVKTIEATQRQLYHSEKMASVGQLAAGVAHEINNPIGFIRSNINSAQSYITKLSEFAEQLKAGGDAESLSSAWRAANLDFILEDFVELLADSIEGADRVALIVADLKGFSNVDRAEEEVIDINEIIRSVCNIANYQIKHTAEVKLELGELPPIRCRPGHLGQVFLNILLNAGQAMNGKQGEIRIQTVHKGNEIVIAITDTGQGIPDSVLTRIFEPFYTTRDVGEGTGLGLTVCQDIVNAHDGRIEVASKAGIGTTFNITLPHKD